MPVLDEIAARLAAQGAGIVGSTIFLGSKAVIPTGDGPYLSLVETGGTGSRRTHNGTPVARPTVQILSRATAYNVARARLLLAFNALGGDKGLHNVILGTTFYQSVTPRQQPTDIGLDGSGRPMIVFNVDVEKAPDGIAGTLPSVPTTVGYQLVDSLGGDANGFVLPSAPDVYPSGAAFSALVPGSWPIFLDPATVTVNYYFEATARVSAAGARVKVALFDLTNAPNVALPGTELIFSADQTVGERKRSGAITLPVGVTIGAKLTTNSATVDGAAWGCRILRI